MIHSTRVHRNTITYTGESNDHLEIYRMARKLGCILSDERTTYLNTQNQNSLARRSCSGFILFSYGETISIPLGNPTGTSLPHPCNLFFDNIFFL